MTADAITETGDATFASDVLERSRELPVVVDFWAPWCGPCRLISPILEGLAAEYADRIQLVKVDIDENPQVAVQYGISSIPAVVAFRDGAPVSQFLGAVPEQQARTFFESLLPSEADLLAKAGAEAGVAGEIGAARDHFEAALEKDRNHRGAAIALAALELEAGNLDRAEQLADRWPADADARQLIALVGFRRAAADGDRAAMEARLSSDSDDAAAHYVLGSLLAVAGEWESALEHLLATVRLDRSLDDDGGRLRLLDAFNVLGDEHPLTREYRQRLGSLLF